MKAAILSNAARMAFIHNHPSGHVEPSPEDIQLTKQLDQCGQLFDIKLLDHVIVSDDGNYGSFLEKGLIKDSPDSMGLRISEEDACENCGKA
jgi:DNA repair protein RadC